MESPLIGWIRDRLHEGVLSSQLKDDCWEQFGTKQAMVVIDSGGFTSTTRDSGILHFLSKLIQIRDLVCPILSQFNGQNVRCEADNFFAEFDQVTDAVEACVAAHVAVLNRNLVVDESLQYSLSIGIGYGPVLRAGHEGVYGDQMNIASKLGEDTAGPHELLLSDTAYAQIADRTSIQFKECSMVKSNTTISYYKTQIALPTVS